jgi:hypothetical protein
VRGKPRATPLGGRRIGDAFWFAFLMRAISATYAVQAKYQGRQKSPCAAEWTLHRGAAHLLPDDDTRARIRELPAINNLGVRTFGTNLLTVRVDLIN